MEERSDAELYGLAVGGDREAVRAIVERYHVDLVRHANAKTAARFKVEDAVANAWIRFFQHLKAAAADPRKAMRKPESLRFWLLTATRNSLMELFRKDKRERDLEDRATGEAKALGGVVYEPDFLERLTTEERRRILRTAFQELSDVCRELLSLLAMDPRPEYAEIAEMVGRPVGSIGPTRRRCLEHLRRLATA